MILDARWFEAVLHALTIERLRYERTVSVIHSIRWHADRKTAIVPGSLEASDEFRVSLTVTLTRNGINSRDKL